MKKLFVLALPALLCACSGAKEDGNDAAANSEAAAEAQPTLPPAFQALLDSGNAAYRAEDYARARTHYTRAVQLDSTVAAGWFGLYMAEQKAGNAAEADRAMKRAQAISPSLGGGTAPHGAAAPEAPEAEEGRP